MTGMYADGSGNDGHELRKPNIRAPDVGVGGGRLTSLRGAREAVGGHPKMLRLACKGPHRPKVFVLNHHTYSVRRYSVWACGDRSLCCVCELVLS